MPHVFHHSRHATFAHAEVADAKNLADRVPTGPEMAGQGFIDDHDLFRPVDIVGIIVAAGAQRDAHRLQVVLTDYPRKRGGNMARQITFSFRTYDEFSIAAQGQCVGQPRRFNAGHRGNPAQQLIKIASGCRT